MDFEIRLLLSARKLQQQHARNQVRAYTSEIDAEIGKRLKILKDNGATVSDLLELLGTSNYQAYLGYVRAEPRQPQPPIELSTLMEGHI